jgi:2'-hydroxyisoflavone reductase
VRLAKRDWDAVIDTSVIAPAYVLASAQTLAPCTAHYTYISSVSAYRDFPRYPVTEDSATYECASDSIGDVEYGALKAGSERAVMTAFPGHCLVVRPGLIVGPHDNVGRLPWWLTRFARGGAILAPGTPDRRFRAVDVRDLAAWILDTTRRAIPGIVNVPGPDNITFGGMLARCAEATAAHRGGRATLTWVDDTTLTEAGLHAWQELPYWAPDTPEYAAITDISGDRALHTGLRYRPLADSIHDTWRWLRTLAEAQGRAVPEFSRYEGTGLDPEHERQILGAQRTLKPDS